MRSRFISNIPRFAVALAVSLMLAFMPFTVNLQKYRITLERNEAHAIAPVFAGALAFLEECAAVAGFASVGDFIATGAGVCAVGTGLTIGTATGINLGNSASDNLNALIDTADYPAWESLDSSTKQSWGSEDNYNAAKYNSLMVTFGLGEDYEQYQQAWGAGTADGFSFSTTSQDNLEQLGRIGTNWINGTGNAISDIVNSNLFNRSEVVSWAPANNYKYVNPENDANWPSGLTRTILYSEITAFNLRYKDGSTTQQRNTTFNSPVYSFYWTEYLSNGLTGLYTVNFSKTSFTETLSNGRVQNSYSAMTDDRQIYYRTYNVQLINGMSDLELINVAYIGDQTGVLSGSIPNYVIGNILYGESQTLSNSVIDYPEQEIEEGELDDELVYYPESGINDDTTWQDLTTEPDEPVNPDNPSEPDLSGIIALLTHIDNDIHNLNIPGEPDLQPLITVVQHIDSDLHKLQFTSTGELKVVDIPAWTTLDNIYTRLGQILSVLNSQNDAASAPDLIGQFDFDEFENKVPDLLETISELAPFGSILLLSSMYSILANYTKIDNPELVFPFEFGGFDNQNHELIIDLSWLDDIKPLINFLCIAMLVIAIANATIRIVEIEAAS